MKKLVFELEPSDFNNTIKEVEERILGSEDVMEEMDNSVKGNIKCKKKLYI